MFEIVGDSHFQVEGFIHTVARQSLEDISRVLQTKTGIEEF